MAGIGRATVEGFLQERDADSLDSPEFFQRGRRPGLVLDHLREECQADRGYAIVPGQLLDGLANKRSLLGRNFGVIGGKRAVGAADCREDLSGMLDAEEVEGRDVVPGDEPDFQLRREVRDRHPEIVADSKNALQPLAVALSQRAEQVAAFKVGTSVQPLFELVKHDEDLSFVRYPAAAPQSGHRLGQIEVGRQMRIVFSQSLEEARFCVERRGFDVQARDSGIESRDHAGLQKRRLSAAARTVQQADAKGAVQIRFLDAGLPKPHTFGESVAITRARQQLEKEAGVSAVERPQPLGDDRDLCAGGKVPAGRARPARAKEGGRRAGVVGRFEEVVKIGRQVERGVIPLGDAV